MRFLWCGGRFKFQNIKLKRKNKTYFYLNVCINHEHKIQLNFNQWLVGWGEWLRLGTTSDAYCRVTSSTNLAGFTFLHHTHTQTMYYLWIVCLYNSKRIRIDDTLHCRYIILLPLNKMFFTKINVSSNLIVLMQMQSPNDIT